MNSFHAQERQFFGPNGEREWKEYKRFAFKGDMLKLVVGIMLGNAFNKVVQSVSNNLAMPFFSFLTFSRGDAWRNWSWSPIGGLDIRLGMLAGDVFDFLVVSAVLYLVYVKIIGQVCGGWMPPPAMKQCLLCMEQVHQDAVRCKFCGGIPNGVEGRDGVQDKRAKDGGGQQEGTGGPRGKNRNGVEGPRKSDSGTDGGRGLPKPRRKRK